MENVVAMFEDKGLWLLCSRPEQSRDGWHNPILWRPQEARKKRQHLERGYQLGWNGCRLAHSSELRRRYPKVYAWLKTTMPTIQNTMPVE